MTNFFAIKHDNLVYGEFFFGSSGDGSIKGKRRISSLGTNGRIALITNQDDPFRVLKSKIVNSSFHPVKPFQKVYIAKECKFRRELFRNNGYTIVRKKEDADMIVVPQVRVTASRWYNIAVHDEATNTLELYYTNNSDFRRTIDKEKDKETILEYFKTQDKKVLMIDFQRRKANFVNRCEEYLFVAEVPDSLWSSNGRYITETAVPFKNQPVQISLETLELWRFCTDSSVVSSAICNSNWQEYPQTIHEFLYNDKHHLVVKDPTLREIIMCIEAKQDTITPKDWDMLQQYALYRCGATENGGFISVSDTKNGWLRYLRARVQLATHPIQEETNFDNLIESLR